MQLDISHIEALNVLVIEDNPDDAEILENYLLRISRKKINVEFSTSLTEGLGKLLQASIDLIFLDLSLPDSLNLSGLTKIRQAAPLVPVIVLTGNDDYGLALEALRMGAQDYLTKRELSDSSLERSIDYALERQRGSDICDFLASLVQSSTDAIIGRSLDNKIVSWNKGAERMYGYTAAEMIGQSFDIIVPAEGVEYMNLVLERTKSDLLGDSADVLRVRKDGSKLPVSCSISPLQNSEGVATGSVVVARDITSRLAAEKSSKESHQRLQLAAKAAKIGIWDWNTKDGSIIWDDRMCAFFGRPREDYPEEPGEFFDISVETFMASVHPEDRDRVNAALGKVVEENSNYECSYRIIWPDNTLHYIDASGELCFDSEGQRANMIGVCLDVTERKIMEQNAQEIAARREQIAGAIFQYAPVGIVTLDSDLNITDVNNTFATMAHKQASELLLQSLSAILPEKIFEKAKETAKTGCSVQIARAKIDFGGRLSDYWDVSLWPVLSGVGTVTGAILLATSCTSTVMMEQQREDFVAAVAHDIKNPLIGAGLVLDFLCNNPEDSRYREMLNMMQTSNKDLLGLVQNLVDVYQFETLGYPITCEMVDLQEIVLNCISQIKFFCDSRKITINCKNINVPIAVPADKIGLSRVVMNLLHNGVKFSPPGEIEVAIRQLDQETVEIAISDRGEGISLADQEKLFQRFGQAEAGKRKANSTGLGLYLSRQIIDAHAGQIGCSSEVGVGSTFFVRLPIHQPGKNG